MPWQIRGARKARRRAIFIGVIMLAIILGGIAALYIAYALPPCSLEAEPLLRQLHLCR